MLLLNFLGRVSCEWWGGVTNLNRFARRGKQWLLMKLSFACQRDRHLSFFAVHLAGQDALPVSY
ncbi:hypothetical protein Peur_071302 [Populus x canadensis]